MNAFSGAYTLPSSQRGMVYCSESPMSTVDVSKLSYAQLVELSKTLDKEIQGKRAEELKVLADGYIKKIEASGFTVLEAIEALEPYVTKAGPKRGSGNPAPIMYRDTANPNNVWSGRGRPARWLADYEAQGRSRDEFKV
jgi:DNA-binding protein H-NS